MGSIKEQLAKLTENKKYSASDESKINVYDNVWIPKFYCHLGAIFKNGSFLMIYFTLAPIMMEI